MSVPAFSELTEADINKIRLIIKEEIEAAITKSEARTKAYIDASEARTKEYIAQEIAKVNTVISEMDTRLTSEIRSLDQRLTGEIRSVEKQLNGLFYVAPGVWSLSSLSLSGYPRSSSRYSENRLAHKTKKLKHSKNRLKPYKKKWKFTDRNKFKHRKTFDFY